MTKFSIIVPVYNTSDYLEDCFNSILNQTYENYEIIVINDGSKDNSELIIKEYLKKDKRFKYFKKENGGLSDARNYGIKKSSGDYIIFVDSDDTINKKLLENLEKEIEKNKNLDVIKYQIEVVENDIIKKQESILFNNLEGKDSFKKLVDDDLFVTSWSYAYNLDFWRKNNFEFEKGKIHEDFGLTPKIILTAKNISSIDYYGYNYFIRKNSIMTNLSEEKKEKMITDTLFHFENLYNFGEKLNDDIKIIYNSFLANALLNKGKILNEKELKKYSKKLKNKKIYLLLLDDTLIRKIKKTVIEISPYLYIKFFSK